MQKSVCGYLVPFSNDRCKTGWVFLKKSYLMWCISGYFSGKFNIKIRFIKKITAGV